MHKFLIYVSLHKVTYFVTIFSVSEMELIPLFVKPFFFLL